MKLTIVFGLTLATLVAGQIGRDKSTILASGHSLIKGADQAMAELVKWGKSYDTAVLKQEQAQLRKLIAQLEAATEQSAISRIGEETDKMELTIAFEIQKINNLVYGPPEF